MIHRRGGGEKFDPAAIVDVNCGDKLSQGRVGSPKRPILNGKLIPLRQCRQRSALPRGMCVPGRTGQAGISAMASLEIRRKSD
jgi:hypothetical protein